VLRTLKPEPLVETSEGTTMEKKKPPYLKPWKEAELHVQEWTVSRHKANPLATMKSGSYHIQVGTKDTLAGFVVIPDMIRVAGTLDICWGKTPLGLDHFSLNLGNAVTFTLVGRIEYRGDWEGIP
jgi:hypothetical protein